jgi:hypothetical protein
MISAMRWLAAVIALAGCHSAHPSLSMPETTQRLLVGASIDFSGAWEAQCAPDDGILGAHHPHYHSCNEKPFKMTVECSGPCDAKVHENELHFWQASVTFPQPGDIRVHAVLTRTDTGDTFDREGRFVVSWPARVDLFCTTGYVHEPCSKGVDARDPLVYPSLEGGTGPTPLLRINGKPVPTYDKGVSLADLFPEARTERGGVAPGVYEVEVAVGPVRGQWHVVAR